MLMQYLIRQSFEGYCCEAEYTGGDDSSLPVCSVSCTVHLQLYIDILQVRPELTYNKQICIVDGL